MQLSKIIAAICILASSHITAVDGSDFLAALVRRCLGQRIDVSDTDIFDLYRFFQYPPAKRPSHNEVLFYLDPPERDVLARLHRRVIEAKWNARNFELNAKESDALERLYAIKGKPEKMNADEKDIPLKIELTSEQLARVRSIDLPYISGGRLEIQGTRSRGNYVPSFTGYHLFTADDGKKYYSLQPFHNPNTHEFIAGKGMVALPNPPEVQAEDIVEMHKFIRDRAVVPDAVAQPLGIHYVGSQLRVLYELIHTDDEGRDLYYHPTPEILAQRDRVFGHGRSLRENSFNPMDDLQGDYMRIHNGRIRVGVLVRVIDFLPAVKKGAVFRLKPDSSETDLK